ncbi:MAG: uroporphyrinogen decarboxylase family protein [Bacillota bacterium]
MSKDLYAPLPKGEVIKAVERKNPSRIPLVRAKWWGEGLEEQYGSRLGGLDKYPEDVEWAWVEPLVDPSAMGLSWEWGGRKGLDANPVLDDWRKLDEFISKLPAPESDSRFEPLKPVAEKAHRENRYLLFAFWRLFFEKPWELRGMENLMIDYYENPETVHKLHASLCDTYCAYIRHAGKILEPDGLWTSDDLGHQRGPMMSPAIFHAFQFPYYVKIGAELDKYSMHFWLHSCGDNTELLPDLIAAGLDVFHPVQKHTMDEKTVAEKYGARLSFLAGLDVQHTLREKDPPGVREEVRFLIDTFDKPEGGMAIAAGNGIVAGTPLENIEAFLNEALRYGAAHRGKYGK